MNFEQLASEGKTVIYRQTSNPEEVFEGWEFWGKRKTENETEYMWRKIVTFAEAEQYHIEQIEARS